MSNDPQPHPRATKRPASVCKPAHWTTTPPPEPARVDLDNDPLGTDPVRYGDWERNGIAIDF